MAEPELAMVVGVPAPRGRTVVPQDTAQLVAKVVVQCRDRLLRDALACRLSREDRMVVSGVAATGADLVRLCDLRKPDLVVLEADPDDWDVVELVIRLRRSHRPRVIGLYHELSSERTIQLGEVGMDRFFPRSSGLRPLIVTVRELVQARRQTEVRTLPAPIRLTDRELDVLRLIGAGRTVHDVASALDITVRTVENHKRRIFAKLDVHSQAQAIADVVKLGMLDDHTLSAYGATPVTTLEGRGRRTLGLITGRGGPAREEAARILLNCGVPLIIEQPDKPSPRRYPAPQPGSVVVAVMVDPTEEDWAAGANLRARMIAVLSSQFDAGSVTDAALRGAMAVLPAEQLADRLFSVFMLVRDGCLVLDADYARPVLAAARSWTSAGHALTTAELTRREHDVLVRICLGDSVRQTARALGVAIKTVESVQGRLFRKLGVRNRAGALAMAHELGLLAGAGGS